MPFNLSVVSMDPSLKHPFPALIAGPTCCGKTQFFKHLLKAGEDIIEGAPEKTNIMPITEGIMLFYREAFPMSYQLAGRVLIWQQ